MKFNEDRLSTLSQDPYTGEILADTLKDLATETLIYRRIIAFLLLAYMTS